MNSDFAEGKPCSLLGFLGYWKLDYGGDQRLSDRVD